MAKYDLTWQTSDVTFLDALLLATGGEGGAPLQEILLMADAIDGTVYTLIEVTQAVEKLMAAGCIQFQKSKLSLSSDFMLKYECITEPDQDKLMQLLQGSKLSPESIDDARETLKKTKLKNHYQQYQEQFG